jgi:hypothetical protein
MERERLTEYHIQSGVATRRDAGESQEDKVYYLHGPRDRMHATP